MTEAELTALAAKAYGDAPPEFSPLTDDGDALRLAVWLGIDLEWRADGRVAAYRHANANGYCFTAFESSRENRAENTRLAITRAAAEIGRQMQGAERDKEINQ